MSNPESYNHGAPGERSPVDENAAQWQFEAPDNATSTPEQPTVGLTTEQIQQGIAEFNKTNGLESSDVPVPWVDPASVEQPFQLPQMTSEELATTNAAYDQAAQERVDARELPAVTEPRKRLFGKFAIGRARRADKAPDQPIPYVAPSKPGDPFNFE